MRPPTCQAQLELPLLLRTSPQIHRPTNHQRIRSSRYATAAAVAPAPSIHAPPPPIQHYPASQPPSHKPPDLRKSQLLRSYISLLRSTPLMLFYQHNNLLAKEWISIRRELAFALRRAENPESEPKESSQSQQTSSPFDPAASIRLQIINTGIFAPALRVVTFFNPPSATSPQDPIHPTEQATAQLTHGLSRDAYMSTIYPPKRKNKSALRRARKRNTPLHTLLSGPIAVLTFPKVSPDHLATALKILSPTPGSKSAFPAPRKKDAPGYHESDTQTGLQKLMLLGARVDGKSMDVERVRWVGGLKGGVDALRGELVALLQGVGMNLTQRLEGVGTGLWGVVEGRRRMLENEEQTEKSQS